MYIVDLDFFFFVFANRYQRLVLTSCVSDVVHQRRVLTSHVSDEPHQRRVLTRRVSDVRHQRRGFSDVVTSETRKSASVMRCYHRCKFIDAEFQCL